MLAVHTITHSSCCTAWHAKKIPAPFCKIFLHPCKKAGPVLRYVQMVTCKYSHTCNFGHEVPAASHLSQIIAVFTQTDRKSAGPSRSARPRNSHARNVMLINTDLVVSCILAQYVSLQVFCGCGWDIDECGWDIFQCRWDTVECGWDVVECGWDIDECGLDIDECGWDTVECGWDIVECGWDTVECGWDIVASGWDIVEYVWDIVNCGWDITELIEHLTVNALKSQHSWVRSRHPPTQWNLQGGRWSLVLNVCSTLKENLKLALLKSNFAAF